MKPYKYLEKVVEATSEQSFALYETQQALLDGIFEPRRDIKGGHLQLREIKGCYDWKHPETGQVYPKAIRLTLLVPCSLDPKAEDILLAALKMAAMQGARIDPEHPMLPEFDSPLGHAQDKNTIQIDCKMYELLKMAGMGTGKSNYQQSVTYMKQMSRIVVEWENIVSGWEGSSWFLSYQRNKDDGRLKMRFNWRMAGAILGTDGDYAKIDLNERHALKKDASKTLHRWLSAHLWAGRSEYILYETLIKHIWTQEATCTTQRKRLERLKNEILPELAQLSHWSIKTDTRGAYITHHKEKQEK